MEQEEEDVMSDEEEGSEDIDDEFKDDYDNLKDSNVNNLPEIASINQIEDVCATIILSSLFSPCLIIATMTCVENCKSTSVWSTIAGRYGKGWQSRE